MFKQLIQLLTLLSSFILFGCSDTSSPSADSTSSGTFSSPVVNGLKYTTASKSGLTDINGSFSYEDGELIRFYIGDIFVGETLAKSIITPLDLSQDASVASNITDNRVVNLFNLLLSLDADADPSNGIVIPSSITSAAVSTSLPLELPPADFITHTSSINFANTVNITFSQSATVSAFISANYRATSDWGTMTWGTSSWHNP